jgi:hypothetical protein
MYETMNIDTLDKIIMLECVIDQLNEGISTSIDTKDDPNKGYAYSYGYCKASAKIAVRDLETILDHYRSILSKNN